MKIIAAYLLAVLGGNAHPDEAAIKKILSSVGVESDAEKVKKLIHELNGKNLQEVIAAGSAKLTSMPSLGGGSATHSTGAADHKEAAPKKDEPKKEDKKAKKEEPKEEEDTDICWC